MIVLPSFVHHYLSNAFNAELLISTFYINNYRNKKLIPAKFMIVLLFPIDYQVDVKLI